MNPYQNQCDYYFPLCSSCGLGASYHGMCGNNSAFVKHQYVTHTYQIKSQSKSKFKSKPREHRGIVQRGPKKGRLKPGYKYVGKRTSTGLAVIVKMK